MIMIVICDYDYDCMNIYFKSKIENITEFIENFLFYLHI